MYFCREKNANKKEASFLRPSLGIGAGFIVFDGDLGLGFDIF